MRHSAFMKPPLRKSPKETVKKSGTTKPLGDATIAIHTGEERFGVGAPVGTPISRTANFTFANTER